MSWPLDNLGAYGTVPSAAKEVGGMDVLLAQIKNGGRAEGALAGVAVGAVLGVAYWQARRRARRAENALVEVIGRVPWTPDPPAASELDLLQDPVCDHTYPPTGAGVCPSCGLNRPEENRP